MLQANLGHVPMRNVWVIQGEPEKSLWADLPAYQLHETDEVHESAATVLMDSGFK